MNDEAILLAAHQNRTVQAEKMTKSSNGAGDRAELPVMLLAEVPTTLVSAESSVCCSCTVPYHCYETKN